MRKKKKHDPSAAPPLPAMIVGDKDPAAARLPEPPARVPGPAERPSLTPPQDVDRSPLRAFFSLPPDPPEGPSPARPPANAVEPRGRNLNKAGCLAVLVLAVVSGFVEASFPLSDRQKYLGMGAVAVVLVLMDAGMSLYDSDLAYSDRDSDRRMARFRNRLRRLLNIPVV
jgi:hypothetical protein